MELINKIKQMSKVKTIYKWYESTKLINYVEKALRGLLIITFISVWIPAFIYVMSALIKYLL
jgi:hypothetical protein